jgi:hypothetical protein
MEDKAFFFFRSSSALLLASSSSLLAFSSYGDPIPRTSTVLSEQASRTHPGLRTF